jgi:hypothetical protein
MAKFREEFSSVSPEQETSERDASQEEIELLAYNIYLARGAVDGRALDDWLEAERELVARSKPPARMAKAKGV